MVPEVRAMDARVYRMRSPNLQQSRRERAWLGTLRIRCTSLSFFFILTISTTIYRSSMKKVSLESARLIYCGDGHYFRFILKKLAEALHQETPISLQIVKKYPDIVIGSTGDTCPQYYGIPRITVLGENVDDEQIGYLHKLSNVSTLLLHCVKSKQRIYNMQYYPFWVTSFGERRIHTPKDLIKSADAVTQMMGVKKKF